MFPPSAQCVRHHGVMADDTTVGPLETSRHISVWIEATCTAAIGRSFFSALAGADVEFAPHNDFGVLDHVVRLPSGETVYNPMRVIPAGGDEPRCEVVFALRRRPGVTDAEFEADAAAVAADLERLRGLLDG